MRLYFDQNFSPPEVPEFWCCLVCSMLLTNGDQGSTWRYALRNRLCHPFTQLHTYNEVLMSPIHHCYLLQDLWGWHIWGWQWMMQMFEHQLVSVCRPSAQEHLRTQCLLVHVLYVHNVVIQIHEHWGKVLPVILQVQCQHQIHTHHHFTRTKMTQNCNLLLTHTQTCVTRPIWESNTIL